MCVTTANDTKNFPMTKHHGDGAKAWKGLCGLCVWTKKCKKKEEEGDSGEQYKI